MWQMKLVVAFCLLFGVLQMVSALFKLTNAYCESYNQSLAVIKECRLRAIRRDVVVLNTNVDFLQPAYKIGVNAMVLKKANGYKPFVMNATIDACAFMRKRNNPVISLILDLLTETTNLNHTCPYVGEQLIRGFYPRHELLKLPLPNGDYALHLTWFLHSKKVFITNVQFTFSK